MNYQGWDFSHTLLADAQKAAKLAELKVNPYSNFPTTFGAEIIFYCAMSVVVVFFVLYLWLLRQSIKRLAKLRNTPRSSDNQAAEAAQI